MTLFFHLRTSFIATLGVLQCLQEQHFDIQKLELTSQKN